MNVKLVFFCLLFIGSVNAHFRRYQALAKLTHKRHKREQQQKIVPRNQKLPPQQNRSRRFHCFKCFK